MKQKVISVIVICLLLISFFAFGTNAYDYTRYSLSWDRSKISCQNDDVCLLSENGSQLYIEKVSPDTASSSLSLPFPIVSYDVFSGTVCALCNDTSNHQLAVYTYDIDSDCLDSFYIARNMIWNDIGFSLSSDGLFLLDSGNGRRINRYSFSGKEEFYYTFHSDVTCIIQGFDGYTYAVAGNTLFRLTSGAVITVSGASVNNKARFISYDTVVDLSGNVFKLDSDQLSLLFRCDGASLSGGAVSDRYYFSDGDTVAEFNASGEKTGYCRLNADVISVCASQDRIIAATSDGGICVNTLYQNDFTEINTQKDADQSGDNDTEIIRRDITSDIYTIDYENLYITDIPAGTTITQLKKRLSYAGYSLHIYENDVEKTSGACAAGMAAVFSGNNRYTFFLSVTGDVNGDGKLNTKDRNALMDFFINEWNFSGVYLDAADVNRDGFVDLLDTVKICQLIS